MEFVQPGLIPWSPIQIKMIKHEAVGSGEGLEIAMVMPEGVFPAKGNCHR